MIEKIRTYLGFCLRAGKVLFGVDDIETHRKKIHLLLIDDALAENSKKKVYKANETFQAPLLTVEAGLLGDLVHRPGVKAMAIKDFNLAKAILQTAEQQPQFKFNSGGNN